MADEKKSDDKKTKQKAGDPHENAVQFLLHHVMKHGDGPSSIAAQEHLAEIHKDNPPDADPDDQYGAKMEEARVKMADDAAIEAAAKQKKEDAEAKKADDEAAAKAEQHRKHLASVEEKAKASDAASKTKK